MQVLAQFNTKSGCYLRCLWLGTGFPLSCFSVTAGITEVKRVWSLSPNPQPLHHRNFEMCISPYCSSAYCGSAAVTNSCINHCHDNTCNICCQTAPSRWGSSAQPEGWREAEAAPPEHCLWGKEQQASPSCLLCQCPLLPCTLGWAERCWNSWALCSVPASWCHVG